MIHVVIRTCSRDDDLARICYESFIYNNIDAKYYFSAQRGSYKFINKLNVPTFYREYVDNYGGQSGAIGFVRSLDAFNFNDADIVLISDADILVCDNFIPLLQDFEHAGTGASRIWPNAHMVHISGQLQIFDGKTVNRLKSLQNQQIEHEVKNMVARGIDVADDTFNSYMTDLWNCKKLLLDSKLFWKHIKLYNHENLHVKDIIQKYKNT